MVFVYVCEAEEARQHAMGPAVSDKGVWPGFCRKHPGILFFVEKPLNEYQILQKYRET